MFVHEFINVEPASHRPEILQVVISSYVFHGLEISSAIARLI